MPYPNFHSCRLRDPDDFKDDSFRNMEREHEGKRYQVIRGRLKEDDEWADQSFRYPKETWTVSEARQHCKDHDGILFEPAIDEDEDDLSDACCGDQAISNQEAQPKEKSKNRESKQPTSHKTPIRCFEGSQKPYEPFWNWLPVMDGEDPELELDGFISEYSWWGDEITPKKFRDDLQKYGNGAPITVRIHSYGGDVVAASLINTYIRDYPGKVTVQIDGIAASAATVVAVAGDVVKMQESAYFMIHDPLVVFFLAALNIEELSRLADSLQSVKEGIMNVYEGKTGLSRARLSRMMSAETWMDAQKALDLGFVDEIIQAKSKSLVMPDNTAVVNALQNYKKVPPRVLEELQGKNIPPILTDIELQEAESLRQKVNQILKKE